MLNRCTQEVWTACCVQAGQPKKSPVVACALRWVLLLLLARCCVCIKKKSRLLGMEGADVVFLNAMASTKCALPLQVTPASPLPLDMY